MLEWCLLTPCSQTETLNIHSFCFGISNTVIAEITIMANFNGGHFSLVATYKISFSQSGKTLERFGVIFRSGHFAF